MFPSIQPLSAECFCPINKFPEVLQDVDQWDIEHEEDMRKIFNITKIRPISGSGPVPLVDGNNVEVTAGFVSFWRYFDGQIHDVIRETNLKLWKSLLKRLIKHGLQYYMMGEFLSRLMVEIGGCSEEYYNLMKGIKEILDPNMILSRGKFNFWRNEQ